MLQSWLLSLAQAMPWDDPTPAPDVAPAQNPPSVHDLQKGFQQWYTGGSTDEKTFGHGMIAIVAIVVGVAIILHLRQRRTRKKAVDSQFRLGLELSRLVPFPFGTRALLWWVARSTGWPLATLLISSHTFDAALQTWSGRPTFGLIRRWGQQRLLRLQPILFGAGAG